MDKEKHYREAFEVLGLQANADEVNQYLIERYGHTASKSGYQEMRKKLVNEEASRMSVQPAQKTEEEESPSLSPPPGYIPIADIPALFQEVRRLAKRVGGRQNLLALLELALPSGDGQPTPPSSS